MGKITAKDIANMILALPEEQQNVPLIYSYYDDSESSIPCESEVSGVSFHKTGYPTDEPHIMLEEF